MSYSTNLKSSYIDPVYDASKKRTEFRLTDGTTYTSNLRLINLGIEYNRDANDAYAYNLGAGAYGVIDHIQLLAGNELIEEVRDFPKWVTFQNFNNTNDRNKSLNKFTNKSNFGFEMVSGLQATEDIKYASYYDTLQFYQQSDNTSDKQLCWLSLRKVFSFLGSVQYLDTEKLKKLRVVVYYNTNSVYVDGNSHHDLHSSDKTAEPLLVADEVMEGGSMPDVVEYVPVELDRIVVPAVDATVEEGQEQEKKFRVNGFNNKRVQRLLIANSGTTNSKLGINRFGSVSQINQRIQVAVNGANKLPFEGQTGHNRRLAMLHDTWGECNPVDAMTNVGAGSCVAVYEGSTTIRDTIGTFDYFGMVVNDKVDDLQITYARTNAKDVSTTTQTESQFNEALDLTLMAEVPKVAQMKNGVFMTSYLQ